MCGIVGVIQSDGQPTSSDILEQMTRTLAHRGPEGWGVQRVAAQAWHVGLGHARLKIIDLSEAARQPMSNDDGSVWVVFNGEIYNFQELRGDLRRRGCRFKTLSDTEVLLRLYEA